MQMEAPERKQETLCEVDQLCDGKGAGRVVCR